MGNKILWKQDSNGNGIAEGEVKMPVYKDTERGSWYCQFYYEDWTGKRKKILASGRLNAYLADIDRQAQERFERLIEGMKQAQGKTNA